MKKIILDCAPGSPRPGDLIEGVIKDTGLELKETMMRLFGEWTWDYSNVDDVTWKRVQPLLEKRIIQLYDSGLIRYGSWG